ncbi:MAG: c-type cytochrome [Hyphomonadaceae bacterium]|nr:c-type cytochrome [Hyphomonadaceae bacterium]
MSDLGFNKIAFCVLGTGLMVIGLNEVSHAFFHTEHHAKAGWDVPVAEVSSGTGPAIVEGPRDYFKLISEADVEAGKAVTAKCVQCHKFEAGAAALQGPPLYGVVGRDIASLGFKYSTGTGSLSEKEGVWDYEHLDRFLENPKKYAPATLMSFVGLNSRSTGQRDRANLMAYLRTLTPGEPLPLPAPLPEVAPAPADGATPPADGATPPADGAATPAAPGTPASGAPATPAPAQPGQH